MASCKENRRARLDVCAGCGPMSREPVYRDVLCDSCATAKRRGTPLCRCGGVMVLRWEGRRYCARCPQDWLVPIYLVCRETRRERVAWSPRSRYEALASAVGLRPEDLVFDAGSLRDWLTGRTPDPTAEFAAAYAARLGVSRAR